MNHLSSTYAQPSALPAVWVKAIGGETRKLLADTLADDFLTVEFLDQAQNGGRSPDLVVMSAAPDGEETDALVTKLRQQPSIRNVPILLLVPELENANHPELLQLGLLDFASAPFSRQELLIRAKRLLGQAQSESRVRPSDGGGKARRPAGDNDRFQLMIDSIDDYAIFMVDIDGNVISWNRGAESLTGYTEDQALGRPFSSLYSSNTWQPTHLATELEAARCHGRYEEVGTHRRQDGSTYSAQVIIRRVADQQGNAVGFAIVIRDVAEREQAEQALQESEAKFRTITNAMPQMVWSTLPDGYHDYYNRQWYEFTGMPEGSTDGDGWNGMFHPDDRERAWQKWHHCLVTGEPYEIEYRVRHRSGEYRWTLGRALPVHDENGTIVRWMGTCTEIHAQKQAEEALQLASKRKDEFLAMLAHELRNPLGPLYNSTALLRKIAPPTGQTEQTLDVIERQVRYMSRMINDLLDVARISRGKMQLHKESCGLNPIVQQAMEDLRTRFDAADVNLVLRCCDEPLWINGDRTRIAQVIGNLLHNASKFTGAGGTVYVSTHRQTLPQGTQAQVVVQDTGVGIDPALASALFDPFVQAEQGIGRAEGGLGLGLAVVKGLMALHQGSVDAHSEGLGKGTTFTLTFPLQADAGLAAPNKTNAPALETRRLRIVLIDDSVDMVNSLEALLTTDGHEVTTALSGQAGLAAIKSAHPDLVICDIGLPGAMDGYAVARAIRAKGNGDSHIFLMALSGYGHERDREKSRESGFDMHLLKPIDYSELKTLLATAVP